MIKAVKELLKRPVAFHPVLARMMGSTSAAVMLSQGMYWQDIAEGQGEEWFWVTGSGWVDQCGLTQSMQDTGRELLRKTDFWFEKRAGLPAKLYYRIDSDRLIEAIEAYLGGEKQVYRNAGNKDSATRRSSNGRFGKQVTGNADIQESSLESPLEIRKDIMSESENSDGVTFQVDLYERKTEIVTVEAEKQKAIPIAQPPSKVAVPKRDNNDPRKHLEAKRKNLLTDFGSADSQFKKEMIKGQGIKIANEIQLENDIDAVVTRLNEKANMPRGYKTDKKETRTAIRKRLKEYSVEDLYTVVDFKCKEWKDDAKLRQYIRPDTLFNGHFEDYLNAALLDKQNPLTPKANPYEQPKPVHRASDAPKSTVQPAFVE